MYHFYLSCLLQLATNQNVSVVNIFEVCGITDAVLKVPTNTMNN